MSVAIVDYGSGNLHSAAKAFERAARESGHDQPILVTRDPDAVARADRVVLPGVGWIAGEVDRIAPSDASLKIPHMGWNTLAELRHHRLLDGIATGATGLHAYFVHSYELKAADRADLVAQAEYGGPVTAIVARDTMVGTQFHPEKSQRMGLALIANFLKWAP